MVVYDMFHANKTAMQRLRRTR